MKEYFKYSQGFINIDGENLYMTNSGNWSEIGQLQQKSPKTAKKNRQKRFKFDIFLFVVLLGICFSIFRMIESGFSKFPILAILLGFGVYRYFRNELGNVYKIPLDKITGIDISADDAKIHFLNADDLPDFETIDGLGPKAKSILENLKK